MHDLFGDLKVSLSKYGDGIPETWGNKIPPATCFESPQQRAHRIGVPFVAPIKIHRGQRIYDANPVVAVCGGCGRDVYLIEGYSCPRSNCPIQPKAY